MTGIGAKHCRGGWGRRGKDDRKQNTLAPLFKGLSEDGGQEEFSENLHAYPFIEYLSNDSTCCQIHFAGQYL
jgi:hypothetical protein